jgi:KaiC/GvpD/RAD55 family RecA-like ATPase
MKKKRSVTKRVITGIEGLDALLEGGIKPLEKQGLIILIKGPPGAGKTTLALQIALNSGIWKISEKISAYWTVEQHKDDIRRKARIIKVNGKKPRIRIKGIKEFLDSPLEDGLPFWSVRPVVEACLDLHKKISKKRTIKRRIMVLDGLNLLGQKEREYIEIERLLTLLRRQSRIGIVVFEPSPGAYGNIDYHADLVIELRGQEIQEPVRYFLTELRISKSRFQQTGLGWHQYKNRNDGMQVFPSVHFRLSKHKSVETCVNDSITPITELKNVKGRRSHPHKKDPSILSFFLSKGRKINRNQANTSIERGSSTVLLGPRRSLKTQLTFDFLRAGSIMKPPEPGLLVSLIDNQSTIVRQPKTLCDRCCASLWRGEQPPPKCTNKRCYKHIHLLHLPPGCITPAEFLQWLEDCLQRIEQKSGQRIRRLVFWDLAQLEFRFPLLADDPMFLPGLMDYLKYSPCHELKKEDEPRKITSLFMGPSNNKLARAASAMADNVLFCWPDQKNQQEGIAVYVDRIEGHPGDQKLYFARANDRPSPADKKPGMNFRFHPNQDYGAFTNAISMIAEIQSLQGLRPERSKPSTDPAGEPRKMQ